MESENKLTVIEDNSMLVFGSQNNFENAQRMAKALCSSTIVPVMYQGEKNLPNCIVALEMANRIKMSPLMVMQNLYIVHGNPGWSSKFLIATLNVSGRFSPIRYEWRGTEGQDDWGCRAWAYDKSGEKLEGAWVDINMAKKEGWYSKNGSKWQTIPQLMLQYRAGAFFARTYAPEIGMGMQTAEELYDARPIPVEARVIPNEIDPETISTEQEAKDALLRGQIDKAKYDELLSKALGRKDEPEEKSFAEQQIANNAFGLKDIAKEHGTATENS